MKLLHLDIETRPALVRVWSAWKPHIDVDQIVEPTSVLCFTAMWHDDPDNLIFAKAQKVDSHEFREMIRAIHFLLHEADAVCHFNGDSFDLPMLHQEFVRMGLHAPPKIPSIDLRKVCKEKFRPTSGRLAFIGPYFKIGKKVEHEGWPLWNKCLDPQNPGHVDAWHRMEEYNKQDVVLLRKLYVTLRSWLPHSFNAALYEPNAQGKVLCRVCASPNMKKDGLRKTAAFAYQRWQCRNCGAYSQSRKREANLSVEVR